MSINKQKEEQKMLDPKQINFTELREQKSDLVATIGKLEREGLTQKANSLTGIVHLIDSIQDKAVDKYGYKEEDVFLFEKEA